MNPTSTTSRSRTPPREASFGPAAGSEDPRVAEVLESYLVELEAGRKPQRQALLARYPEIAGELARCLDGLEFLHVAVPHLQPPGSRSQADTPPPGGESPRMALGDYRLLREVGRGGMGIVYEAEQLSLGRRVALKVLPFAAALDPRHLQRFKTEAQAAAQLHHPHIVPVYAVGCDRGVHYYAMQFIEGQTLAELIRGLRQLRVEGTRAADSSSSAMLTRPDAVSTQPAAALTTIRSAPPPAFFRTMAALAIQAAEALEYAHQVGVVHRDVKPANLLIDSRGQVWITDFGLARCREDPGVTLSGDVVGTLRYMSPEQGVGKRGLVDQRTDIYALGVTLYELLTLRPALDGQTRGELLWQAAHLEPAPPRQINRLIPSELETIVLKAIAKNPPERYTTAQDLADDLRRFLSDQPIRARRPTVRERATKWARRHRRVVTACAAFLVLALIGLAGGSLLLWREQARSEARFWRAQQAVEDMYTRVAEDWLDRQPYLELVQVDFLRKALTFYQDFSQETGRDPRLRLEAAKAQRRMGDIHRKLGAYDEAEAAYGLAIPRLEALAAESTGQPAYCEQLALGHNNRGHLFRDRGRLQEAEADYRRALALFRGLAAAYPQDEAYRAGLAGIRSNLALVVQALARSGEAEEHYRQALALVEQMTGAAAASSGRRHDLASILNNLAGLLRDTGRPREAEAMYAQALDLWTKLAEQLPGVPVYRQGQGAAHHGRALLLGALGRDQEAGRAFEIALDLRGRLAGEFPAVPQYRQEWAASQQALGALMAAGGRGDEAKKAYRQALRLRQELATRFAGVPAYRQDLVVTQSRLGQLLGEEGQLVEAEQLLREALAGRERLAADCPEASYYQAELAAGLAELADLLWETDQATEARVLYRRALAVRERLTAAFPAQGEPARELAWLLLCPDPEVRDARRALDMARRSLALQPHDGRSWNALGMAQYRLGEWQAARQSLANAAPVPGRDRAMAWLFLAMTCWQLGDEGAARSWFDQAAGWMATQRLGTSELRRLRTEAAALLRLTTKFDPLTDNEGERAASGKDPHRLPST